MEKWSILIDYDHLDWLRKEAKKAGIGHMDLANGIWLTAIKEAMELGRKDT